MEEKFIDNKIAKTTPPVLAFPNFKMSFVVETDSSTFVVGAILTHKKVDGKFHPVDLASRTMIEAGRSFATYERKDLAIIFSLKKFHIYILSSQPFKIVTDHKALNCTFKKKPKHGVLAHSVDILTEYDFKSYKVRVWRMQMQPSCPGNLGLWEPVRRRKVTSNV